MYDDLRDIADRRADHYKNWLLKARKISDAIPDVEAASKWAEADREVINTMPTFVGRDYGLNSLAEYYRNDLDHIQKTVKELPDMEADKLAPIVYSSATASTVTAMDFMNSLDPSNAEIRPWLTQSVQTYKKLQFETGISQKVRSLLAVLNPELVERFNLIEKSYSLSTSVMEKDTKVGISMRNLLEKYRGELWKRAKRANEQKIIWRTIVDRLSKEPPGTHGYNTLLKQEEIYKSLHEKLTHLAKYNETQVGSHADEALHSELLNHLFTVLSSIKIN